jgi:DNA topoisomerase-1
MGPYGAIVQMGSKELSNVKYAMIEGGKTIETITIGEAIELLKYPRNFGMYNGLELLLKKGKYGPYLEYNKKTYSLKNAGVSLDEITREKSIEIITTNDGYVPKK